MGYATREFLGQVWKPSHPSDWLTVQRVNGHAAVVKPRGRTSGTVTLAMSSNSSCTRATSGSCVSAGSQRFSCRRHKSNAAASHYRMAANNFEPYHLNTTRTASIPFFSLQSRTTNTNTHLAEPVQVGPLVLVRAPAGSTDQVH
jgi:hypothetical protein